jgi:hypothetical protein
MKTTIFFAALLFFALSVSAQNNVLFASALNASSTYSADLDGDGDMDVLSASSDDDKIAWYENTDGAGTFSAQKVITTDADRARSVYAADLDGDGDMDVLSASYWDDKIAWYENLDGAGTFSAQKVITTEANGAGSVYAADLDGDGDKDVLSASENDNKIAWYENLDGAGTFSAQKVITTAADEARYVYAADLDGDGDMDVLSASYSDDKIAWYENLDGAGTFSDQKVITTNAAGARSVYAADLDGDGDKDVLSASENDAKIAWYENLDGAGTFSTQNIITTNADGAMSVYAADLDGDGDKDVLSASCWDDKIAWYENLGGGGSFSSQNVVSGFKEIIDSNVVGAGSVYAADLDGDGDMDVLSASSSDDKIAWYENLDGADTFSDQKVITTNAAGASSVYAADLDGDGDKDVLSASENDNKIAWYENLDGAGTFSAQKVITTAADEARYVYAADLDGDGDMDVLSASYSDDKIAWYENLDGAGTFSDQKVITTNAAGASSVYAADLDGDGDKDVLSTSENDAKIAWYENLDGAGTFSAQKVIATDEYVGYDVYAADLDGDGDTDVLGSETHGNLGWYENLNGEGDFSSSNTIDDEVWGLESVYASDLDNDGDLDVLAISREMSRLNWYENSNGNGVFSDRKIIDHEYGLTSLFVADLDGDGDTDVLSASDEGEIAWYENLLYLPNETHFTPIWQGNAYQPMTFMIGGAALDDIQLVAGDEIGIFDGVKCVGAGILDHTLDASNHEDYIQITAAKDDGDGNGFTEGNPITYKLWRSSDGLELEVKEPQYPYEGSDSEVFVGLATNYVILEQVEVSTNEKVSSITLADGEQDCFNATNTIIVADEGDVIVESGASANFIAGHSILFRPGFHAQAGSYVDAHITTTGSFCDDLPAAPIMAAEPIADKSVEFEEPELEDDTIERQSLMVYPNPNNGKFTIKLENIESETLVLMYNSIGQKVYDVTMTEQLHSVELPNVQRGIYFIKAINNQKQFDQKIVIQ